MSRPAPIDAAAPTQLWCGACSTAVTPRNGRCPTCGGPARKVSDDVGELAWALYRDEQLSVGEVARAILPTGLTTHTSAELLESALRRYFRKRGYRTRPLSQTLKGRACRAPVTCCETNARGRSCEGNPIKGSPYCWQHHPDYEHNREALAHLERMRQNRRWVAELVPMQPFVTWLEQRRGELALPPEQRRFRDRDEGLARLSEATGIAATTLAKWMRFRSSSGKPKHSITQSKVEQILKHDATTTFADLYGELAGYSDIDVDGLR